MIERHEMKNTQLTFKRYEKKYLLSPEEYARLRRRLDGHIAPDEFYKSTVCSLYYDTDSFELIRRSIDGPIYKEKLRLRSYNVPAPDGEVFVELKKKFKGVVYKRRVLMANDAASEWLSGAREAPDDGQVTREVEWFLRTHAVSPRVFIACDREAYAVPGEAELRITFDSSIRWREDHLALTEGMHGQELLPPGYTLMEIKLPNAAPLWLARLLSEEELYPVRFSKYGVCYKENLVNGVILSV